MEPTVRALIGAALILGMIVLALTFRAVSLNSTYTPTDQTAFEAQVHDLPDGGEFTWNGRHYIIIDE